MSQIVGIGSVVAAVLLALLLAAGADLASGKIIEEWQSPPAPRSSTCSARSRR